MSVDRMAETPPRTPGQVEWIRQRFFPEALLRLARSTQDYYDSHGAYLPDVAALAYIEGVAARELEAALREAKTTIRRAQMRYEHPLVEHLARCECVSCEGIRKIDAALAPSAAPTETGCAACEGDPEAHGLHVCGKEPYS